MRKGLKQHGRGIWSAVDADGEDGPTRSQRRTWQKLLEMRKAGESVEFVRVAGTLFILADIGDGLGRQIQWEFLRKS